MNLKAMLLSAAVTVASLSAAEATVWRLHDHGFGNLGPYYGLRLDDQLNGSQVFSATTNGAFVTLTWDGEEDSTAVIEGTLAFNSDAATPATDDLFSDVIYTLTGLKKVGNGFQALAGSGQICGGILDDCFDLEGKADKGYVLNFLDNGHRIPGDNSTFVAEGWIKGKDTNDWLVRATVVPLPASALLLLSGLGGLAAFRRLRKSA